MRRLSAERAEAIARMVRLPPEARALDLGCGAGGYGIALARAHPGLRVVGVDRDEDALGIAAESIRAEGLEGRIALRRMDFMQEPLGDGYDLVILGSILVLFPQDECRRLLERAKACLSPGGSIGISEELLDETRTSPATSAVFAVHILLNTRGGRVHSRKDVLEWMKDLGFQGVHGVPMRGFHWIAGRKP
jgi:cyclopropane fatty-acyl-phospholipid synthase-like methyltransferase